MTKPIIQKIKFSGVSSETLYSQYLNPKVHSEITDSTAVISSKEGKNFSAYDGYITGKNIRLLPDKMIVQSWKASDWKENEESVLVLEFENSGEDCFLQMTHIGVPESELSGISRGWKDFYWSPWKKYLKEL